MFLGKREIGIGCEPLVIAEIGINHKGSLDIAKKMVYEAFKSGCECVKHQTHIIEDEMTDDAKQIFPSHDKRSIWDIMQECALSKEDELKLKNYTESLGLIYLSTPFSRKAADFLNEIGVLGFKIGSGECDNLPLIQHIADFGKPIIMSTGMNSIESIKRSVKIFENTNSEFCLLECTNLYPSPPENVSLKGIIELQNNFKNIPIGFSDDSIGPWMALSSVALGACIIERHFTLSRYDKGPDILCSMDPSELRFLIDRSKEIFIAVNNPKERTFEEEEVYKFARASVVTYKSIKKGQIFTKDNLWVKRPGSGEIPGFDYYDVIGKKANNDLKNNVQLKFSDIEQNP